MEVVELANINGKLNLEDENSKFILKLGSMCNDSYIYDQDGKTDVKGDPTEVAIVNAGLQYGQDKNELYKQMKRISEISFDSTRKLMTTIHEYHGKYMVITKGAPDVLLKRSISITDGNKALDLTSEKVEKINEYNSIMANNALRVLAVAYKEIEELPLQIESETIEKDLNFVRINWYDRSTASRCKGCNRYLQASRN